MTTSALIGLPLTIVDADTVADAKTAFTLPARTVSIGWQTSWPVNPAVVDIALQVAMDETGPWTEIDATTAVGGEFRTVNSPVAARFIRADVDTNTGGAAVTVQVICKVANP